MKNRILTFIIGLLIGAILTTSGFLVYSKSINKNYNQMMRLMEGNGQMPNGNMGNPPTKPEGEFKMKVQNTNI